MLCASTGCHASCSMQVRPLMQSLSCLAARYALSSGYHPDKSLLKIERFRRGGHHSSSQGKEVATLQTDTTQSSSRPGSATSEPIAVPTHGRGMLGICPWGHYMPVLSATITSATSSFLEATFLVDCVAIWHGCSAQEWLFVCEAPRCQETPRVDISCGLD